MPGTSDLRASTTQPVRKASDRLQVFRPDTGRLAAEVIDLHANRNRADEDFVGSTMGELHPASASSATPIEVPVALAVERTLPDPAAGIIDGNASEQTVLLVTVEVQIERFGRTLRHACTPSRVWA